MNHRSSTSKVSPPGFSKKWRTIALIVLTLAVVVAGVSIALPRQKAANAAGATGNWSMYMYNLGHSGYNPAEKTINTTTAKNLKLHWSFKSGNSITSQPVEANGLIYFGSWDGFEYALNPNGTLAWRQNLGQTTDQNCNPVTVGVHSSPTFNSISIGGTLTPVLFLGGGQSDFYALNANTGKVIWKTQLGPTPNSFVWSSPAYYKGSIYIGVASYGDCPLVRGQFIKLNATTGAMQQVFDTAPKQCKSAGVWGAPAIDPADGAVFIDTSNGSCGTTPLPYAFAIVKLRLSDFSVLDSWQLPQSLRNGAGDWGASPMFFKATIQGVVHNMVGAANKDGIFYALDRANLSQGPLWSSIIATGGGCPECGQGSVSSSAWNGKTILVGGGIATINGNTCKGSLHAIDPATGTFSWQDCFTDGAVLGPVVAVPGVVVVGEGTHLLVISSATGKILFDYPVSNKFWSPASISNGVLYIGNLNGTFYALGT